MGKVWQIRAAIKGIRPTVWRRVLVSESATLADLHRVIQEAFGWQDCHLHEFVIRDVHYGDPQYDEDFEGDLRDEATVTLRQLGLTERARFDYVYDFGDNWEHVLQVERILPADTGMRLPACTDGARACPPEDVGGIGGYAGFLKAMANPGHPEHEEYRTWVGGDFDPERFDLTAAKRRVNVSGRSRLDPRWSTSAGVTPPPGGPAFDARNAAAVVEHEPAARELALRRDVETLLGYLRDHKVTGTKSTGNLPLKAVAEICAAFVDPPALERRIGDFVDRCRSEDDVEPLIFVHVLASEAELLSGGPGRRWRLTEQGRSYLSSPAAAQVVILLNAWWHRVNWLAFASYNILGETLPLKANRAALSHLRALSVGKPVRPEPFVDSLIAEVGWTWSQDAAFDIRAAMGSIIEAILIRPMEQFGVLSTESVTEKGPFGDLKTLVSFALTDFGQALVQTLE